MGNKSCTTNIVLLGQSSGGGCSSLDVQMGCVADQCTLAQEELEKADK